MTKLIICGLSVLMAAVCTHKTEWMEKHNVSPTLMFAIATVVWMAFFIWLKFYIGIDIEE